MGSPARRQSLLTSQAPKPHPPQPHHCVSYVPVRDLRHQLLNYTKFRLDTPLRMAT